MLRWLLMPQAVEPWLGLVPFVAVSLMWVVPDRRVERWIASRQWDR